MLSNDFEPDGQVLTALLVILPKHGALELAADGTFVYTPKAGFSGIDSFTYRASDGTLLSEPATATIAVSPPGKLPEDLNADGAVNPGDLAFMLASFGKTSGATAIEGDLDGDGRIGIRDAITLQRSFTPPAEPAAVVAAARKSGAPRLNAVRAIRMLAADRQPSNAAVDEVFSTAASAPAARRSRIVLRR